MKTKNRLFIILTNILVGMCVGCFISYCFFGRTVDEITKLKEYISSIEQELETNSENGSKDNVVTELSEYRALNIDELFAYAKAKIDENYYSESSRAMISDILQKGVKNISSSDNIADISAICIDVKEEIDAIDTIVVLGRIYTLQEAYEKELLTKKELQIIATYHNYEYSSSDILSDKLEMEIRETLAWELTLKEWNEGAVVPVEDVILTKFYGKYNRAYVVSFDYGQAGAYSAPVDLDIDGVIFHFGHPRYIERLVVYSLG